MLRCDLAALSLTMHFMSYQDRIMSRHLGHQRCNGTYRDHIRGLMFVMSLQMINIIVVVSQDITEAMMCLTSRTLNASVSRHR